MAPATAPLLVGCLLLIVAGIGKLRQPDLTVGALRSVGVRAPAAAVRAGGAGEIALGVSAAVTGAGALAALVALTYAGFAVFILLALRRGGALSSCGCLGRPDTPPTRLHVVVTAAIAIGAGAAAIDGGGLDGWDGSASDPVVLGYAALAAWLAWAVLALLPHLRPRPAGKDR
jgi:hypothetical protein